jgi:hypothetical protein
MVLCLLKNQLSEETTFRSVDLKPPVAPPAGVQSLLQQRPFCGFKFYYVHKSNFQDAAKFPDIQSRIETD